MKLPLFVLAMLAALSFAHVSAKIVSFPSDNFSIDVPADWNSVQLPPLPQGCRAVSAARSAASGNAYVIMTTDLPAFGSPDEFLDGMLKSLNAQGWKASPIQDETIDGKPFAVFTLSHENGLRQMLTAATFISKRAYVVQTVAPKGNVDQSPELNAIVQSFHFLQPVQSINRHDSPGGSRAYQIGYLVGRFGPYLAAIIVLVIFAMKKAKSPR